MGWLCRCPGIVWEPIRKWAHTQLVREHSATVISARWATVDWSWHKSGISVRELISTKKKKRERDRGEKKLKRGINGRTFSQNSRKAKKKPPQCSEHFSRLALASDVFDSNSCKGYKYVPFFFFILVLCWILGSGGVQCKTALNTINVSSLLLPGPNVHAKKAQAS